MCKRNEETKATPLGNGLTVAMATYPHTLKWGRFYFEGQSSLYPPLLSFIPPPVRGSKVWQVDEAWQ